MTALWSCVVAVTAAFAAYLGVLSVLHSIAGSHLDGKNTAGSYSALIVFETDEPFCGSYYMLPQYHMGLDARQGGLCVELSLCVNDSTLPYSAN